jgi:tetratricopeptide (TPR) repeat protein
MTRLRLLSLGFVAAGLGVASLSLPAFVPTAAYAADSVRPEVGKPLQNALDQAKKRNFKAAMDEVGHAEAVPNKTAHETLLIEETRGSIAQQAGDTPAAIKSFEAVIKSGSLEGPEEVKMIQAVATLYNEQKDYPNTIHWLQVYRQKGGNDPAMRNLLISAYFGAKDYANAGKEQADQIAAEEKAGQVPPETQYQLLLNCYLNQNDMTNYVVVMEKLVLHYAKPDYWADLIRRTSTKTGFASTRLALDVSRLRFITGGLKTHDDYTDMTQAALQEHLPGEAKDIIDKGFTAGLVGKDEKLAVRDNKLRDLVNKSVTDDQASIDGKAGEATSSKDGQEMLNIGFDYVTSGQFDKGIKLMEDGVRADAQKHPEDGKLHLGIAYFRAGQKAKAVQMWKTVGGTDGTADLARLWLLYSNAKPAS